MKIPGPLVAGVQKGGALLERLRFPLFITLGAAIFAGAVFIRLQLPAATLFNPDSWGFIGPTLLHQETGVFPQTHGRNFLYPALLDLVFSSSGNFDHLAAWQHALGVLAGALWLLLWLLWARQLPPGWIRRWAAPLLGLGASFVFLFNGMGLVFEHHIRPEGVFPLFAIAQLLFLGAALRFALSQKRLLLSGMLAALGSVAVLASVALKPSWTLTLGTLPLLVLLVFAGTGKLRPAASILVGLLLGGVLWGVGVRSWQEANNWQPDESSKLFLSQSLVSVHADLVLKTASPNPASPGFLEEFSAAFEESKKQIKPYAMLGFNPDTIFYQTPVFGNLPGSVDEKHRFLMALYFGALKNAPLPMVQKWLRQFGVALFPIRTWIYRADYQVRRDFERSAADLRSRAEGKNPTTAARLQSEATVADRIAQTLEKNSRLTLNLRRDLTDIIRVLVPAGVLSALLCGLCFLFLRQSPWRTCAIEGFLWCATFLSGIATVAVVHSFDIDRYAEILNFLNLLMAGFCAVFLLTILNALLLRIRRTSA